MKGDQNETNEIIHSYANQALPLNQGLILNIKQFNFFQILENIKKVKILCDIKKCDPFCGSTRSYQVLGINEKNEENLIMTASQENLSCDSNGYMLVYKMNNAIIGTLGYQINTNCCLGNCCLGNCCKGCCTKCCNECFSCNCEKTPCCCCCCCICKNCGKCCECNNGGCFLGGCCNEAGCCCFCEDGCCHGGCCNFCDCCCCKRGCCHEPCCERGCCPCPNCENILLDIRFLNTMEEALDINAGVYVGTLYEPYNCFGLCPSNIGYKKCGERFAIEYKCCAFTNIEIGIIDLKKKEKVGNIKQTKTFLGDVKTYEVDFPQEAFPLEKLLIISEIFMFVFLKWDQGGYNTTIITKKRRTLPGFQIE